MVKDIACVASKLYVVISELAELGIVQTKLLLLGWNTKREAGNQVYKEEDNVGKDK